MADDVRGCGEPSLETNKLRLQSNSSDDIYRHWFPVYYELATLPIDSAAVRHSPDIIARLRALGWDTSPQTFDAYWHRVSWISNHCRGRVVEIGCGMGNITRWIAANAAVNSVLALDVLESYIATLKNFSRPKVTAICYDVSLGGERIASDGPFETVVLSELIEHMSLEQELTVVNAVRPYLSPGATWVITTPIGFMTDTDHKRGFGNLLFCWHTRLIYGSILSKSDNKIQQYVLCKDSKPHHILEWRVRTTLAGVLGHVFGLTTTRHTFLSLPAWRQKLRAWSRKFRL